MVMASLIAPTEFRLPSDETPCFGPIMTRVFDLDNILHSPYSGIWPSINERITLSLIELFGNDG
jgi:putative hydrolase of the HAD superfamily